MNALTRNEIKARLEALPRFKLSHLNTELEEAHRLREALHLLPRPSPSAGGKGAKFAVPRILVKREDTTGLAFGGNKGRHFEFELGHVLGGGYDTVINVNNYHSNQARFIAAACAKAGLRYILVSTDMLDAPLQGNLLLCKIMGADIHRVPGKGAVEYARKLAGEMRSQGGRPYIVNDDMFPEMMGTIGFIECGLELEAQLAEHGVGGPVRVWGLSGRSIPGLKLYAKNRGLAWQATAVTYSPGTTADVEKAMLRGGGLAADALKLPARLDAGDIDVLTAYAGPGYALPYDGVFEAMHLAAKTESLILDPNYTGKSMAALIGEIRRGAFSQDDTVVFIHSGGMPQVFAFADEIWDWRPEPPANGEVRRQAR
jgi:1-aminocyclopropane-1-carboxylate deaminase/D-cysteine desulfhydrase-like pyridoxal-dependent ACC family enzyme